MPVVTATRVPSGGVHAVYGGPGGTLHVARGQALAEYLAALLVLAMLIGFGLGGIRNVGVNVVDAIVAARKDKGAFSDFSDFLRKVDAVACTKKTVESLCKAGAFDSLGHSRKGLVAVHA